MKAILLPSDKGGCGQYRMRMPGECMIAKGLDVEIRDTTMYPGYGLEDADLVVIQRPTSMPAVRLVEALQGHGVTVVVEIDDSLHNLPQGHPLRGKVVEYERENQSAEALRQACDRADLVTCTTPALAKLYAPHGRVAVIPNMIPRARIYAGAEHRPPSDRGKRPRAVVGYCGPAHFHGWDLGVVGKGVAQAQQAAGFDFYGIGARNLPELFRARGTADNWFELRDYTATGYAAHQATIDLGLAPLTICHFNDCKSDLKLLEYAALGIGAVASPSQQYAAFAGLSIGVVTARTPREWREQIIAQLEEPPDPHALIDHAWTRTIEGNLHRWINAWIEAHDRKNEAKCQHEPF